MVPTSWLRLTVWTSVYNLVWTRHVIIQKLLEQMEQRIKFTEVLTTSTVRPANSFVSNRSFISTNFGTEVGVDELRK